MTASAPMTDKTAYFDAMYGHSTDPYALRTRWYEQRKRAVLMAALPHPRYGRAFEPGCGAAELTVELAARCDHLLASDFSDNAVIAARQRTESLDNVRVDKHVLPRDWPTSEAPFDLIVLSEVGYFLDPFAMREVARCCAASLSPEGVLVACDWRPDFKERALSTEAVHAALADLGLPQCVRHDEDDFLLRVWSRDSRSVAQLEGIR
ncbi:SAM-dependent methyltransferase [soil metagenome]